jgi:hypothetical protein
MEEEAQEFSTPLQETHSLKREKQAFLTEPAQEDM